MIRTRQGRHRQRLFCESAQVKHHHYSGRLQRAMVDFGADHPFGQVPSKLKEHYGIDVPPSTVQRLTEEHAQRIDEWAGTESVAVRSSADVIVAELDGSMVPIVETPTKEVGVDRRKLRSLSYKEARLSLAHSLGSRTCQVNATLGSVAQAGAQWKGCVEQVGLSPKSQIHCLGDGAPWIAEQAEQQFGRQATYTVDYYHLCEYLAAAAESLGGGAFLEAQKTAMKEGRVDDVLTVLKAHREGPEIPDERAPIRACWRYINNRPGQFNYAKAIEQDWPIGSGEVESAHRTVIQKRLKLAGAWWRVDHAQQMLSLRVLRMNGHWETYWQNLRIEKRAA